MFKFDDVIHHWRTASPSQCCAWTRSLNDSSWTRSYFRRTWTERTVLLHHERLGMGIESRFLFRTGAKSTDSLESLASLLNDSAYRFRSRQMRRDVTHTLLCFGSEVLNQNAANTAPPRKNRIVRSHQTRRGDKIPCKVNVETCIVQIFRERKPATSFCRNDSQSAFNSVTTEWHV